MSKLYTIKKDPLFADSTYRIKAAPRDILVATHEKNGEKMVGVFSVRGESALVDVDMPDGTYENLLGGTAEVHDGRLASAGQPIIIRK